MAKGYGIPDLDEDPHRILGVIEGSGGEEIRSAYLKKIKEYPPDKFPEEFERIRDAYEILKNPRRRTLLQLRSVDPEAPLLDLLNSLEDNRLFVGLGPWLDEMKR